MANRETRERPQKRTKGENLAGSQPGSALESTAAEAGGGTDTLLSLDTDTGPQRKAIAIDGKRYELKFMDELPLKDRLKFSRRMSKLSRLAGMDQAAYAELDDGVIDDLDRALHLCTADLLIAPDRVIDRLNPAQKMQIVQVFAASMGGGGEADDVSGEAEAAAVEAPTPAPLPSSTAVTGPYRLSSGTTEGAGRTG